MNPACVMAMPMNVAEFLRDNQKLPPSHFSRCHRRSFLSCCRLVNKIRGWRRTWFNNTCTYMLRLKDLDFGSGGRSAAMAARLKFRRLIVMHLQSGTFFGKRKHRGRAPARRQLWQFSPYTSICSAATRCNPVQLDYCWGRVWLPAGLPRAGGRL